jgi:hypothetical protein
MEVGALTTLGNFGSHRPEEDDDDKPGPTSGSSRSDWRAVTMETVPREGKRDRSQTLQAQTAQKRKWWYACRLFGTNSLKEGAMWRIDPLLGRGLEEISSKHVNNTRGIVRQLLSK